MLAAFLPHLPPESCSLGLGGEGGGADMEGMHQLSLLEIYEHTLIKAWGLCLLPASRGPGANAALSVSALLWPRPAGQRLLRASVQGHWCARKTCLETLIGAARITGVLL